MFDMTLAAIASMHAVPVLLVGLATRRRVPLLMSALAAGAIGFLFGDPRQVLANQAGVVAAWLLALQLAKWREPRPARPARAATARTRSGSRRSSWAFNLLLIAVVGWILYNSWKVDPAPDAAQRAAQQARAPGQADPGALQPRGTSAGAFEAGEVRQGKARRLPRDEDLRHCLELKDVDAIRACAERG